MSNELAIGINQHRKAAFEKLAARGRKFATIIAPQAYVSPAARPGAGVAILPGAVISYGVEIGDNVIVNAGVVIDHDSVIGAHTHLAPGAVIASCSKIGECLRVTRGGEFLENR